MQDNRIRIVQISDCHVAADPGALYRGQSADGNLAAVVQAARDWQPRLVILTGDVSEDGSRESYQRTSGLLAQIGAELIALPGNHDDVDLMRQFFPAGPWRGPYLHRLDCWQLILLDSTEPGRISGAFSPEQLEQLHGALQNGEEKHQLLALHHQPVPVGAPWIDRYSLESSEQFFAVTDRSSKLRCIVWGHVHQDFIAQRKQRVLLGAPSSAANSLPGTEKFSLDPAGPACRWLELSVDGSVETGILCPTIGRGRAGAQSDGSNSHRIR